MTYRFEVSGRIPEMRLNLPTGSLTVSEWPRVKPIWGETIRRRYGVCAHPNFGGTPYEAVDAWTGRLATLGAGMFRGMYVPNLRQVRDTLDRARAFGLKWCATVASLKTDEDQLRARLDHILENALDVVVAIEGINEIDKDGLTDAEIAKAVKFQRIIWEYVTSHPSMSHITVLSPALQVNVTPKQLHRCADAGMIGLYHAVSRHQYNAADPPHVAELTDACDMYEAIWGCSRFWVTETGYTNALDSRDVRRISTAGSAAYAVPNLLGFLFLEPRVEAVFRYEALNDPKPLSNNEAHFGLWRCESMDPATWKAKLEVDVVRNFLHLLSDLAVAFDPPEVELEVTAPAGVEWAVTQTTGAAPLVHLWRPQARVWDPTSETDLAVPPDVVHVATPARTQTVDVAVGAISVPLG